MKKNIENRKFTRRFKLAASLTILIYSQAALSFDCGQGVNCSISQLASFLDGAKHNFNTSDYKYDQIYSISPATIVFDQRLLVRFSAKDRADFKAQFNKKLVAAQICGIPDLRQMLDQGISLKYINSDIDRNHITTYQIDPRDC